MECYFLKIFKFTKQLSQVLISVFLLAVLLTSCVDPPNYSEVPEIEFIGFAPQIVEVGDTLRITFSFKDGDGDIGFQSFNPSDSLTDESLCDGTYYGEPDASLFVTRSETGCLIPFNMPFIPPKGSSRAISGNITLYMFESNLICLPPEGGSVGDIINMDYDTTYFYIQLRDRAGNLSNVIQTPEIILKCN